jgi:hypothetical protein
VYLPTCDETGFYLKVIGFNFLELITQIRRKCELLKWEPQNQYHFVLPIGRPGN